MDVLSKIRRTIIEVGGVYKIKTILGDLIKEEQMTLLDDPEFYDVNTKTLKLGNLCARDINSNKPPTVNLGGKLYTTYCALTQLSNTIDPSIVSKLHHNIDKIYNFLRRDLKYDNKVKFHSLMKTILEYDDPANTMNIIVNFIESTDSVDEIANALDKFRKSNEVSESEIEQFLRQVKSAGHQEYEKSFYGEHFKKYSTKVVLKYRTEEENKSILQRVEDVIDGKHTVKKAVGILYQNIISNYSSEEMIKSDLECIKNVYNEKGDVVIEAGNYLEVKKIDYAADSYLSEFMAMYKSSKLPDYAHETKFVNTYNQIIDGLFELFEKRKDILADIQRSFAGIIYDDRIFIKNDDIELYWSNKGRSNCLKDHRLSIRYRIKNPSLIGYVYEGGDVLTPKPIKIILPSEKIFCIKETTRIENVGENYNIKKITNILLEGRKEDARAKYPNVPESDFNYFVENDPSGNQKYLGWLLKYFPQVGPAYLMEYIKFFHQYQNMFIEKDISRHTPTSLDREMVDVQEKLLQKQEKKQVKKQSIKLYEDDRWLVVSPKSWKASCYYGAGTKWCITMKGNPSYWNRYIKNSTFFFIIDKTKKQDDPLYKVAYRKIGRRGKYELWNAPDYEFSNSTIGQEYMEELPKEIKERINSLHLQNFPPTEGRAEWIDDDPRAQAIVNGLDTEIIENVDDYWYGMPVYEVDDSEHYVVGEGGEMDEALRENYNDYSDDDLIEYYDNDGYYLTMNDEYGFISSEVSEYLSSLSDREKLELSDLLDKESDIESKIDELESNLEDEEDEEEIESIEDELESLRTELNELVDVADEILGDRYREDWERCLSDGPRECFVSEKGWFSNTYELYRSGLVDLDRYGLIENIVYNQSDYDAICPYGWDNFTDDDGGTWYVFKVDY